VDGPSGTALGRELSRDSLTDRKPAATSQEDLQVYPEVYVSDRVKILGPAVEADDGAVCLPDAPVPGIKHQHARA